VRQNDRIDPQGDEKMNIRLTLPKMLLFVAAALVLSCGGSGSDELNGGVNASSVADASGTFNAIEGLLFDGTGGNSRLDTRSATTAATFCHSCCKYKEDRRRIVNRIREMGLGLCYFKAVEAQTGFTIGIQDYAYAELDGDPNAAAGTLFVRIGKFTDTAGKRCIRMQQCRGAAQMQDFEICDIDGGISSHWDHLFAENLDGTSFDGEASMDLTVHGDANGVKAASADAAFTDAFGAGSGNFSGDRDAKTNILKGYFGQEFTLNNFTYKGQGAACVYAGNGTGSSKFAGSREFPAVCPAVGTSGSCLCPAGMSRLDRTCTQTVDETVESFAFDPGPPPVCTLVTPPEQSPWFTDASECVLPTQATPPSGFQTAWDCAAPNGFTKIDVTAVDATACKPVKDLIVAAWLIKPCDEQLRALVVTP
jgi:hypothetical protein